MSIKSQEEMARKYGITYDEEEWPDIKGGPTDPISYEAVMMLTLARTAWLKRKVDRLRSLV